VDVWRVHRHLLHLGYPLHHRRARPPGSPHARTPHRNIRL
jgi:hypothetical protein